jgi:menaquinone-dependent protoporphyrinogen oxidase
MRVLIAYGSRYGSTRETAEHMERHIAEAGHQVEVLDAADVDVLRDYDVVLIGSGIYAGHVRRRVVRLLHRIARQHPTLPIALFALGPMVPQEERPQDWQDVRERLDRLVDRIDGLDVLETAVFGGVIEPERMNFMFARMGGRDLRSWSDIDRWTDGVLQRVRTHVTH